MPRYECPQCGATTFPESRDDNPHCSICHRSRHPPELLELRALVEQQAQEIARLRAQLERHCLQNVQ